MKVQVTPDGAVQLIVEMDESYWSKVYAGQIAAGKATRVVVLSANDLNEAEAAGRALAKRMHKEGGE
jgi:hypothetical protein